MTSWVILLRGVNVGGANRLPMADLRTTLSTVGFDDVRTHIQSGNVVARTDADEASIVASVMRALEREHGLVVPVVARSAEELAAIAGRHPDTGSGLDPKFLHVHFLDAAPDPGSADRLDPEAFAPDRWVVDGREIYATYPDGSARSKLTIEVFERAFGRTATARNLNTVRRLVELSRG